MNSNLLSHPDIVPFLVSEKRKLVLPATGTSTVVDKAANMCQVLALQTELSRVGFSLAADALQALGQRDTASVVLARRAIHDTVKQLVGADRKFVPLFKNFPSDVPDDVDYLLSRLVGYLQSALGVGGEGFRALSCGHVIDERVDDLARFGACPVCQCQGPETSGSAAGTRSRARLLERLPVKLLGLATEADVLAVYANLAGARTSLSDAQKAFVCAVIQADATKAVAALPTQILFKENLALVVAQLLRAGAPTHALRERLGTPTDVLRVAVALCEGDLSLKQSTRFKLSNPQRRFLLEALEGLAHSSQDMAEEMLKYLGRWLRLGEVLHVGAQSARHPKTALAFHALRNDASGITTYAARVEALMNPQAPTTKGRAVRRKRKTTARLDAVEQQALLSVLGERPGEMARRIDAMLRRGVPAESLAQALGAVAPQVSTSILLTLLTHLRSRSAKSAERAFMPKGSSAKMFVLAGDSRAPIASSDALALQGSVRDELLRRFSERAPLGKVYIDPALARVVVPFSQRSASNGLTPLPRGSRLALSPQTCTVRAFLNWKNPQGQTVDVDLSCGLYGEDWSKLGHLSWTNMHAMGESTHSGDIRSGSGPHGAAEFIDLDLAALREAGVRYACVVVYSWTGQPFSTLECFAGFMERQDALRGKPFEPRTVRHKFSLTGETQTVVPLCIDVLSGEVAWADLSLKGASRYNSIERSSEQVCAMFRAVLAMKDTRMSLKELFELHVAARGTLVDSREQADLVLDEDQLFALDEVIAHWL